jgi:hypothetical protein
MLTISYSVRSSPSAKCASSAIGIFQFFNVFNNVTFSMENALPLYNSDYNFISSILSL